MDKRSHDEAVPKTRPIVLNIYNPGNLLRIEDDIPDFPIHAGVIGINRLRQNGFMTFEFKWDVVGFPRHDFSAEIDTIKNNSF